jgi:methionyl-tRNA formyltransferase
MLTIGILSSGKLGFQTLQKLISIYSIKFILTDKQSTDIIALAKEKQIPLYAGNPRNGKGFEMIKNIEVEVIASINYLFLIEKDIISHPTKLIFNIHGSLLPKYRGRTPHVWAIINGEKMTGITAHVVDEGCDTGKIIHQIEVPIGDEDTGAVILNKYELQYFPLIEKVLNNLKSGDIKFKDQDHYKATYFGKRTPSDGQIDWDLTNEEIRDWVRAQAYPYPGAFTFYEKRKIIIDKVCPIDFPKHKLYQNGEIISSNPDVIIKTKNGALKLLSYREEKLTFIVGKRFKNENWK